MLEQVLEQELVLELEQVQGLGQVLGQELQLEPMEDRRVQLGREL